MSYSFATVNLVSANCLVSFSPFSFLSRTSIFSCFSSESYSNCCAVTNFCFDVSNCKSSWSFFSRSCLRSNSTYSIFSLYSFNRGSTDARSPASSSCIFYRDISASCLKLCSYSSSFCSLSALYWYADCFFSSISSVAFLSLSTVC